MNEQWINSMKDLYQGEERTAPEGLLESIKQEMVLRGIAPASETKKRKVIPLFWRRAVAAAAVIAIIAGATVILHKYINDSSCEELQNCIIDKENASRNINSTAVGQDSNDAKEAEETGSNYGAIPAADSASNKASRRPVTGHRQNDPARTTGENAANISPAATISHTASDNTAKENKAATVVSTSIKKADADKPADMQNDCEKASADNDEVLKRMKIGLYYTHLFGNTPYTSQHSRTNESGMAVTDDENHYRPIRLGVSLHYQFSSKWSLRTGLTYTSIESDILTSTAKTSASTKQRLVYLSIPVGMDYSIWHNEHFNVYGSAGTEFGVLLMGTETEHKPLFNVQAAVGMEYRIHKPLKVFVEPGIMYYMQGDGKVHSAITEKPFNVGLILGFRYDLGW